MGEPAVDGIRFFDHAVLPVMDLWRAERFYTEVLDGAIFQKVGMNYRPPRPTGNGAADLFVDPPGAFVKMGRSHIGLFLQTQVPVQPPADLERGFPCLGLAIAEGVFGDVVQRVRAAGVAVGQEGMRTLGGSQWRAVRCADSEGNCLDLVATAAAAGSHQVLGLSYLGAETCDLAATGAFYVDVLGLEIAAEGPGWLAVTVPSGQALVFHEVHTLSPSMVGPYFGRHFAFYVDDDGFRTIVGRLQAAGIPEGDALGRNVPGEYASYFYDPNGLWLQLLNHDSARATRGRPLMRYSPVGIA